MNMAWVIAIVMWVLAIWITFANCYRHVQMAQQRKKGIQQNISGTPIVATVFVCFFPLDYLAR